MSRWKIYEVVTDSDGVIATSSVEKSFVAESASGTTSERVVSSARQRSMPMTSAHTGRGVANDKKV